MATPAARALRRRDRRRHARRARAAAARLPARLLPAARRRAAGSARAERVDDGVARTAAPRPTGTCAPAIASPRAPSGRTASRARARPTRAATARSTSTRWTPGTRRRSGSTSTRATRTCAPTRAAARATSSSRSEASQVAESRRPVLLDETGLITRYYLPLADVRSELLEPSETFTECPYKGRCDYWSVRAPDGTLVPRRRLGLCPAAARRRRHRRATSASGRSARTPCSASTATSCRVRSAHPAATASRRCRRWRARHVMPPPEGMRGVAAGQLQRDRARPNNRAEGPPDGVMDMAHERAGGPRLWRY